MNNVNDHKPGLLNSDAACELLRSPDGLFKIVNIFSCGICGSGLEVRGKRYACGNPEGSCDDAVPSTL